MSGESRGVQHTSLTPVRGRGVLSRSLRTARVLSGWSSHCLIHERYVHMSTITLHICRRFFRTWSYLKEAYNIGVNKKKRKNFTLGHTSIGNTYKILTLVLVAGKTCLLLLLSYRDLTLDRGKAIFLSGWCRWMLVGLPNPSYLWGGCVRL